MRANSGWAQLEGEGWDQGWLKPRLLVALGDKDQRLAEVINGCVTTSLDPVFLSSDVQLGRRNQASEHVLEPSRLIENRVPHG